MLEHVADTDIVKLMFQVMRDFFESSPSRNSNSTEPTNNAEFDVMRQRLLDCIESFTRYVSHSKEIIPHFENIFNLVHQASNMAIYHFNILQAGPKIMDGHQTMSNRNMKLSGQIFALLRKEIS